MKNIFEKAITDEVIERINQLNPSTKPNWGKMSTDQMLAHCNVTYELDFEDKHPKPKGFKKWMLKTFVKNIVVSEKPYKRNGRTAPEFLIASEKDFNLEKGRLRTPHKSLGKTSGSKIYFVRRIFARRHLQRSLFFR